MVSKDSILGKSKSAWQGKCKTNVKKGRKSKRGGGVLGEYDKEKP